MAVNLSGLRIQAATRAPSGQWVAWGAHEAPDGHAIIGVEVDTGDVRRLEVDHFGRTHIQITRSQDGEMYAYCGRPAHFLRYDRQAEKLVDLGVPAPEGHYFLESAISPDDVFYVGSFPDAELAYCDMKTGEIGTAGRLPDDDRQRYIIHPEISDAGVVYCPVGLHHMELWSWDPATEDKQQILPSELTEHHGRPELWPGTDGKVYGEALDTHFRCEPDRIIMGETCEPRQNTFRFRTTDRWQVGDVDDQDQLHLIDCQTGEEGHRSTDYQGKPLRIYSLGPEYDGKIWGGTIGPARTFTFDPENRVFTDLGHFVRGGTEIYDSVITEEGLLMGSYGGAFMDLYHPDEPLEDGKNPEPLPRVGGQERPNQITRGPDGHYYVSTKRLKGRLGGALMRVDVEQREIEAWTDIVPDQSLWSCAPVPETNEMFCTTTISGGTSSEPTRDEAVCFLWDIESEQIAEIVKPIPGATDYWAGVRANNGHICGVASNCRYYVFDPLKRETLHVGETPVDELHFPFLRDKPVGPRGLIVGIGSESIFGIDPIKHSCQKLAEHDSLSGRVHGFYVTDEGTAYYGHASHLWRCFLFR